MAAPAKKTFKLSLLDCIVIMVTSSVLLSINVYAFQDSDRLLLDRYGSTPVDGAILLLLVNIFLVAGAVGIVRSVTTLLKQRHHTHDPSRRDDGE